MQSTFENNRKQLITRIETISTLDSITKTKLALDLFQYQYKYNEFYQKYALLLNKTIENVDSIDKIPFLPISLFKNYIIKTGRWKNESIYQSSGTTGSISSRHYIRSTDWYYKNAFKGFLEFFPDSENTAILALLPSYLEQGESSLVAMIDYFIKKSKQPSSGFYLHDIDRLNNQIKENENNNIPTIIFGVSYALLDFAEMYPQRLYNTTIIETGGMKGRRKELPKAEIHEILSKSFGLNDIYSEYGMTELQSQAYSLSNGIFKPSKTMDIYIRELSDPLSMLGYNMNGGINIIDYANIDSCSFIATEDMGKKYNDNSFELMGRMDAADIRGCNLLVNDIL